ncbi:MAG: hypothetical protein HYV38_03345 [Candidatus Levybacteria bacterium]|nr:hypothetical protein [Candidatus Levybacteria bacterium]
MRKLWIAALLLATIVAGCFPNNVATTTASCAFVTGDGRDGRDAKLHRVLYPGQAVRVANEEKVSYFPCNSRNYIINDGTVTNANGERVGDRDRLIEATTEKGVPITIAVTAYWTLNQSETSMRQFFNVCFKYLCASPQDLSGDTNYSTEGWNGMLGENFGPVLDRTAREAAQNAEDSIWQRHDPTQYKILGDTMSDNFAEVIRANLGYPEDLFCGSGNSIWPDPNRPGEGKFECYPVRIVVDDVQRVQVQTDDSTDGTLAVNKLRLENAQALYGPNAGYWLGLQDSIEKCSAAGTTCIFNIGATGGQAVPIPANSPVPTPTSSPEVSN